MNPDPSPPKDGRCVVCGKVRKRPTKVTGRKPVAAYATERDFATDPFCSRVCCEEWHELPVREGRAA